MISSNAAQIAQRMIRRKAAVLRNLSAAAVTIGNELTGHAKQILQAEVYSVPIPLKAASDRKLSPNAAVRKKTTKGKHGRWQRTGHLKRSESSRPEGPVVVLRNNAKYSAARAALGGPNPPNAAGRKAGVQTGKSPTRAVGNWQLRAVRRKRKRILELRRQAVLKALLRP